MSAQHLYSLFRSRGHEGRQQGDSHGDSFHQVVEDCGQTVLFSLIAAQDPRLCLVDIFVETLKDGEDLCQGIRRAQLIHLLFDFFIGGGDNSLEVGIDSLRLFDLFGSKKPRD